MMFWTRLVKVNLVGELTLSHLSKLSLNSNKSHLAFTMDSGFVGVIDISDNAITKMETKHESVS